MNLCADFFYRYCYCGYYVYYVYCLMILLIYFIVLGGFIEICCNCYNDEMVFTLKMFGYFINSFCCYSVNYDLYLE